MTRTVAVLVWISVNSRSGLEDSIHIFAINSVHIYTGATSIFCTRPHLQRRLAEMFRYTSDDVFDFLSVYFLPIFRDAAVCQQSGGRLPRLVRGSDELSRLSTGWWSHLHPSASTSTCSDSPDTAALNQCCLPELQRLLHLLPDTVPTFSTPHPSPHSRTNPLPPNQRFSAATGDPQPSTPSAKASDGPTHPASTPTGSPDNHPGTDLPDAFSHATHTVLLGVEKAVV